MVSVLAGRNVLDIKCNFPPAAQQYEPARGYDTVGNIL